jgi:CCR4-NOT transcription complex subunit 9
MPFNNNSQRFNRLESNSFAGSSQGGPNLQVEQDKETIIRFIDELKYSDLRDNSLLELSRQREHFQELAPFMWHSVGTIPALLLEIVSVYPLLSPPLLDSKTSNKACNVLAML